MLTTNLSKFKPTYIQHFVKYTIVLVLQCCVIIKCIPSETTESVNDIQHYYFRNKAFYSQKTAFINMFPPNVEYYLNLNNISDTFVGHEVINLRDAKHNRYYKIPEYMNESMANELKNKVKIICLVLTIDTQHEDRAIHVKNTWGKRCNKLLFMSNVEDESLPSIKVDAEDGFDNLWGKTKAVFKYVQEFHYKDADWFMKADDDTFVILENLRKLLLKYDTNFPIFFGCKVNRLIDEGYMDGGAGYVLSRAALDKFANMLKLNKTICNSGPEGAEDIEIAQCMTQIGVKKLDTRDILGFQRFNPFVPHLHFFPDNDSKWYWQNVGAPALKGSSDSVITFHHIFDRNMYVLDYLTYRLGPYGKGYTPLKKKINSTTRSTSSPQIEEIITIPDYEYFS